MSLSEEETTKKINHVAALEDTINDLTLVLEMWLNGYPFDENHKTKQRELVDRACVLIKKPKSMEDLADLLGQTNKVYRCNKCQVEQVTGDSLGGTEHCPGGIFEFTKII